MATFRRPALVPALYYQDSWAAIDFLERAFGFERAMVITDDGGAVAHAELALGESLIMLGSGLGGLTASPAATGGKVTQSVHLQLADGLDEHCERARAAGATIQMEPEDQFYGDRTYRALDPEGHLWTFGQAIRAVSREEAEQATGYRIEGWV